MTIRSSDLDDDDPARWFDEAFASSIQPAIERRPPNFESYLQNVEHTELMESFGRVRRPAATARIEVEDEKAKDGTAT